ncbi:30S ribosomal protein S17 [Candidatus Uhrbacteria bacterium]|nr:30S ribosomal protein S17 [Candidatus Uhrbacteria bacterium]
METQTKKRTFVGTVVSDKMQKTRVVLVETRKQHPKYRKQYTVSHRFKVHDETNTTKVGDRVTFVECRPISKDKRWRIL